MPAKEAENACTKVNGTELDGRTLRVNEAHPTGMTSGPPRGRGGGDWGGPGGGYGGHGGGYGGHGGYNDGYGGGKCHS